MQKIKFSPENEFFGVLRERVNAYFEKNNLSRNGGMKMVWKTVFMLSLFFVPYFFMISGIYDYAITVIVCYTIMGVGVAGIGLSIMHDANHGAYSNNPTVNKWLGKTLDIVGGNALNWKIQHNVLHHSFTNIDGMDEDISRTKLLRLNPHQGQSFMYQFQHLYAWILYGLLTVSWITTKDFSQLFRYQKMGLVKGQGENFYKVLIEVVFTKIIYYAYILVLPLILLDVHWGIIVGSFFLQHFIAGLILGLIFQPAHVLELTDFPLPKEGTIENSWAIHQMRTTANFAPGNSLFSWYVGGLNYQVEHHLFPNICHVHYTYISSIVEKTAKEFGVPYHSNPTFIGAVKQHFKMLRLLGNQKIN